MQAHDRQAVTAYEVAELVEHAVVRQVVLRVARDDASPVQDRRGVLRLAGRPADGRGGRLAAAAVADDDGELAGPLVGQPAGQVLERVEAGLHERVAQHQVLRRVPGEHHLGERDEVAALLGGVPGPAAHGVCVAREIAYRAVDLSQSDPELRHGATVSAGIG